MTSVISISYSPKPEQKVASNVSIVMPHHPSRPELRDRALKSVKSQTVLPKTIWVGKDLFERGPSIVRNLLCSKVDTEFIAFLDDDDELLENHIELLLDASAEADVVFSLWKNSGGHGPPVQRAIDHDMEYLYTCNYIPITVLVRTEAFKEVGGFNIDDRHEDWGLWLKMHEAGFRFKRIKEVTWVYHREKSGRLRKRKTPQIWNPRGLV